MGPVGVICIIVVFIYTLVSPTLSAKSVYSCGNEALVGVFQVPETLKVQDPHEYLVLEDKNVTLEYQFQVVGRPGSQQCSENSEVNVNLNDTSSPVRFTPEGGLWWINSNGSSWIYSSPEAYCISKYNNISLSLKICTDQCQPNGQKICTQKCCPLGSSVTMTTASSFQCSASSSSSTELFAFSSRNVTQMSISIPHANWSCSNRAQWTRVAAGQDVWLEMKDENNQCIDETIDANNLAKLALFQCVESGEIDAGVNSNEAVKSKTTLEFFSYENAPEVISSSNAEPYQEFIYKCGDELDDEFWAASKPFHIHYGQKKLDYFQNDLNYSAMFNFTLRTKNVDCDESFLISTSMPENVYKSGRNLTKLKFSPDGYLSYDFDNGELLDEIYYHRNRYCVQNITDEALTIRMCKSSCFHRPEEKGSENCLPKCCPFGWILDSETKECKEVKEDWVPSVYVNRLASKPLPHWDGVMKYVPPDFDCYNDSKDIGHFPLNNIRLIANGKLVRRLTQMNRGSTIRWAAHTSAGGQPFCVDAYWNTSKFSLFEPSETHLLVTRCLQTETSEQQKRNQERKAEAYQLHSHISLPLIFLPCTLAYLSILIVYIMLWDTQNSQGWTIMAFSASQFVLYLVLMVIVGMAIYSNVLVSESMHYVCNALGIIHNFAYISTYSWTAVLTFDVWGKLSTMKQASKTSKGKKRFFFYCCFGVGIPTLIVTIASIMEWGLWEFPEDLVVMPGYSDYCVVTGRAAFLFYQGLPSAILFAGNLAFLVLTFRSLWQTKKNVEILKEKGSSKSQQSSFDNKVVLIGKLMLMMGAFLTFEFIFNFASLIDVSVYFTFLQSYRLLHAIGLFYLFVCSPKIKKQLRDKYPSLRREPSRPGQTNRKFTMTEDMFVSSMGSEDKKNCYPMNGIQQSSRKEPGLFAKHR